MIEPSGSARSRPNRQAGTPALRHRCHFASTGRPCYKAPMQAVLDYLKKNKPRFIQELCDYVRFPSVSAKTEHKPDLAACAEWLLQQHVHAGLSARIFPTAGNPILVSQTL